MKRFTKLGAVFATVAMIAPASASAQAFNPQQLMTGPCASQFKAFMPVMMQSGTRPDPSDTAAMDAILNASAEGKALKVCMDQKNNSGGSTPPAGQPKYQAASTGATTRPTADATCPVITRSLRQGSRGSDVSALQAYLATDQEIYPEGTVSGYFGPATTRAVQRWQRSHNIVSSGTPSTTGYGAVGVKTRNALARCGSL